MAAFGKTSAAAARKLALMSMATAWIGSRTGSGRVWISAQASRFFVPFADFEHARFGLI
jgi:hypothetical protein